MQTLLHRFFLFFSQVPLQPEKQESLGSHSPIISQYAAQHYLHPDQSLQDHTGTVANISIHSHTDHQSLDHNNTPPNHESPIHNTSDHYNNHTNHESPIQNSHEDPNPTTNNGSFITVLDIYYTLVDHRSTTENPLQLMRPCK